MADTIITFNGITHPNIYVLRGRRKAPFAPLNREITNYGNVHRLKKNTFDLLEIDQPIGFKAKTDEKALEIKDSISQWLITKEPSPLQFSNEPDRTYLAVVSGTLDDLSKTAWLWEGTIKFIVFETLGKSHTHTITSTYTTITVNGLKETPWISKTIFNVSTNQFTLETNQGGRITLNYNFIAGDVLEIDYQRRKITLNGKNLAVALSLDSHWLPLKPKTIGIKASHNTTLMYSERYN